MSEDYVCDFFLVPYQKTNCELNGKHFFPFMKHRFFTLLVVAANLAAIASAYSYAHDHSTDCAFWAQQGYCAEPETSQRTQQLCPVECGVLPALVDDSDFSCESWAAEGECEKNPLAMMKDCALACGHASNVCVDLDESCPEWKARGECEESPDFMKNHCAASCFCKRRCFDKHASCARWAKAGHCQSNANFTFLTCPVSCGACESPTQILEDLDPVLCPLWARSGECSRNPQNMAERCGASCRLGEVVCGDLEEYDKCNGWKREGRCESDQDFMLKRCASTCGECTRLEAFYTNILKNGGAKDEL